MAQKFSIEPHKLRIAWSVVWGSVGLLLIVFWVRSYWCADSVTNVSEDLVLTRLGTAPGVFFFGLADYKTTPNIEPPEITDGWEYQEYDVSPLRASAAWIFIFRGDLWAVGVPAWFATLLILAIAVAPWLNLRFSLRTLLIVTTLVAIVLGLAFFGAKT